MAIQNTLNTRLVLRNDLASAWLSANPKLLAGEIGIEKDTGLFKIGDGSKLWSELSYANDIAAEKLRAEGVEESLGLRIKAVEDDYLKAADKEALQAQINTILNNPDAEGAINSITEFTQYIEEHGEIAEGFRTDINANAKAIEDHEAHAEATYETKTDAAQKLTDAKAYADGLHAADVAALGTKVDKVEGKSLVLDTEIERLAGIQSGAQVNVIDSVDEAQFALSEDKKLSLKDVAMGKVTGLEEALAGKAAVATTISGYGITDAYTKTEIDNKLGFVDGNITEALNSYKESNDERVGLVEAEVAKKVNAEEGKSLIADTLISKLEGIQAGAQVNAIETVSSEFVLSETKALSINAIAKEKVTGLVDALAGKVNVEEGKALISTELIGKLEGIAAGAQVNVVEGALLAGVEAEIENKKIVLPFATAEKAGLVKSTAADNGVLVAADGTMSVNRVSVDKLYVPEGHELILNGGGAVV